MITRILSFVNNLTFSPSVLLTIYVCQWTAHALLIRSARSKGGGFGFNPAMVALLTDIMKFIMSLNFIFFDYGWKYGSRNIVMYFYNGLPFIIPAVLYSLYNNIMYLNLSLFQPSVYMVLLNFRIIFVGIFYQLVFSKPLTKTKWFALLLLMCGCVIVEFEFFNFFPDVISSPSPVLTDVSKKSILEFYGIPPYVKYGCILLQAFLSAAGGVSNEYFLKSEIISDTNIQNLYLHGFSIILNVCFWRASVYLSSATTITKPNDISIEKVSTFYLYLLIFCLVTNGAISGLMTGIVLKRLDSIMKTFAAASQMLLTAVLSSLFFDSPLKFQLALGIIICSFAFYLYSRCDIRKEKH